MPKEKIIRLRLEVSEKSVFESCAKLHHLTLSAWLRQAAHEKVGQLPLITRGGIVEIVPGDGETVATQPQVIVRPVSDVFTKIKRPPKARQSSGKPEKRIETEGLRPGPFNPTMGMSEKERHEYNLKTLSKHDW